MSLLYTVIIAAVLKGLDSCDCDSLREENARLRARNEHLELRHGASMELDGFMRRIRAEKVAS